MNWKNNVYTLIAGAFRSESQSFRGRSLGTCNSDCAFKNVMKTALVVQRLYKTATCSNSVNKMPEDLTNSFLGKLRLLFASRWGTKLHEYVDQRHKELGPIYRSYVGPTSAVFINSPEVYRIIFGQLEGSTPRHFVPEAWIIYNTEHTKSLRGLFFM